MIKRICIKKTTEEQGPDDYFITVRTHEDCHAYYLKGVGKPLTYEDLSTLEIDALKMPKSRDNTGFNRSIVWASSTYGQALLKHWVKLGVRIKWDISKSCGSKINSEIIEKMKNETQ